MKKKKESKKIRKIYKTQIPDNVKILFGKFYVFSFLYLIFFFFIYPLVLINKISLFNLIAILVFLSLFYLAIIIDAFKKKKGYSSNLFFILMILVGLAISFSVVKLMIFLEI